MSELSDAVGKALAALETILPPGTVTTAALAQPSFRFLHHAILQVCDQTGFANGLYSEDDRNIRKLASAAAQVLLLSLVPPLPPTCVPPLTRFPTALTAGIGGQTAFLERIVRCVSIARGASEPVIVANMIAGMQPKATCLFLAVSEVVQRCQGTGGRRRREEAGTAGPSGTACNV